MQLSISGWLSVSSSWQMESFLIKARPNGGGGAGCDKLDAYVEENRPWLAMKTIVLPLQSSEAQKNHIVPGDYSRNGVLFVAVS